MSFFNANFVTDELIVSGYNNNPAQIILYDATNSNTLTLKAPSTISSDYTLILPTSDGSADQTLTTDGVTGALSWSEPLGTTLAADDINIGDGAVSISSANGNIVLNAPLGSNCNLVVGTNEVLSAGTGIVNVAAGLEWKIRDSDIKISSPSAGKLDFEADSSIYYTSAFFDINSNVHMANAHVISNLTVNNDFRWRTADFDLDVLDSSTQLRISAIGGIVNIDANTINLITGSGNTCTFFLGGNNTQQEAIARVSSRNYINLSSTTTHSSGIGIRTDTNNTIQSQTNSSDSWRTQPPGFPTKIVKFAAGDANPYTSIPDGCAGIRIQAVGAGGGGGAGSTNSGPDRGGGGGAGEYMEVYLFESNIGSNLYINATLAAGGAAGATNTDGSNAAVSNICLNTTTTIGGVEVCTMAGGIGGTHGNNYALGGEGGTGGTISVGLGWAIPGGPGENGYDRGFAINRSSMGRGGDSYLGSGGRQEIRTAGGTGTDGIRGGGGGSGYRDSGESGPASNGGGGYVIFTFY